MSLWVAVPFGIASAIAYGASTAVQHSAVHRDSQTTDARGLLHLVRNPRWLLSVGGDAVGLLLQVIALSTGPVVLIQPLLVLALPVSLPVGRLLGGPKPQRGDYLACLGIVAALGVFFALLGDPGKGRPLAAHTAGTAIVAALVVGAIACVGVRGQRPTVKAVAYGAVAGAGFGFVGVLLNAAAIAWERNGASILTRADGLVPLIGLVLIGAAAFTLTQVAFQVGALGASFPANESAAPFAAVLLGGLLLHERVPTGPLVLLGYAACLAAIVVGTVRLANPPADQAEAEARGPGTVSDNGQR
jgi:drug/metabolite transporter (DMT)-like permease